MNITQTTGSQCARPCYMRFILLYGVLGWGLCTGVLFSIVFSMIQGLPFKQVALVSIPAFALGGFLWGAVMWLFRKTKCRDS